MEGSVRRGPQLRIQTLGGLGIWFDGARVESVLPAKASLMLAYLASEGTPVSRGVMAGLLWSDRPEERARSSLRVTLTRARSILPGALLADRSSVALGVTVDLDTDVIERGSPRDVLENYHGEFLADVDLADADLFADWLHTRRQTLHTTAMRQLRAGAEAAESTGEWRDVLAFSSRMVDIEPWNEQAHRRVMIALANVDGRSSALVAFDRCTELLDAEFGVEPDAETVELADAIRNGTQDIAASARSTKASAPSNDSTISWRLLGDVGIVIDGEVRDLTGQHPRSLMAHLALNAPDRCGLDDLAAAVWGGDPPQTSKQAIHRHIRGIRSAMGPFGDRIEKVADGYRLTALPDEIDALRATALINAARTAMRLGEVADAADDFQLAVSLWNGTSLGGVAPAGTLTSARSSLDELQLGAIEDLIEAELALGRHRDISSRAEAFALDHPARERAWANLMLTRYRCGRQAEAVDAYHTLRAHLIDHEGIEPSPSVTAVYSQILDQSPAVDAPGDRQRRADRDDRWVVPPSTLTVPLPPALERSDDLPLLGRSVEVDSILERLNRARSGESSTVFIAGEPGIGKTRLATHIAQAAHDADVTVLYGRCDDGLAVPYSAWREALAHLSEHAPPYIARRHIDRFDGALGMLLPALASSENAGQTGPAAADSSQQELLFQATAGLLNEVAGRGPILLVLDDLQWADTSTLKLLQYVTRRIDSRILVLSLHRDTEVDDDHPLSDIISELEAAGSAQLLTLSGLDAGAQADLVAVLTDSDDLGRAEHIAETVAGETNGNPFFFTEIVRSLIETGALDEPDRAMLGNAVPETVQRVVHRRVARLGDDVAGVMRTAGVFGREFDLEVLAAALGRSALDVLGAIEIALGAGLLTDAPLGRDRFAFSHDLVHHTLAAELSHSRRCRTHAAIANAIEGVHGPDVGDRVGELATHLVASEDPTLTQHTIQRCREAGQRAATRHAPNEAVDWFEKALRKLDEDATGDRFLRAQLLVELGTQQRNAGGTEHRATLIAAGQLALENDDVETLVSSVLANSRGMNAHVWEIDEERIELLRSAIDAVGPVESTERADLLAGLANEQWGEEHRSEAESLYREAIALARRLGDPDTLARVLVRTSRARNFRFDRDEFITVNDELRRLSSRSDITDPLLVANCLTTVLNTALRLGIADDVYAAIDELSRAAEALPLPMFTMAAHLGRCLATGLRGDIAAYERDATDTYHHAVDIGDEEALFIFEGQMFCVAYLRGQLANLLDFGIKVANERPDAPLYRSVSVLMHAAAGKVTETRALLDHELQLGIEPSVDMFQIQALTSLANAAATVGHVAACRRLYDVLLRLSGETSGHLVQVGEPIDICLGRMCTVLEQFDEAERHFDIAEEIGSHFEGSWMLAQTAIARAQMLNVRGRPGDRELALAGAMAATATAQDEGYGEIERNARRIIDHVDP